MLLITYQVTLASHKYIYNYVSFRDLSGYSAREQKRKIDRQRSVWRRSRTRKRRKLKRLWRVQNIINFSRQLLFAFLQQNFLHALQRFSFV